MKIEDYFMKKMYPVFLNQQKSTNKSVKVVVKGYATSDETNPKELALDRANDVKGQLDIILQSIKNISFTITTQSFEATIPNDPKREGLTQLFHMTQ